MARSFVLDDQVHYADDRECRACAGDYPQPCPCGGLIHAAGGVETLDAIADESEVIPTSCDRCGRSDDDLAEEVA